MGIGQGGSKRREAGLRTHRGRHCGRQHCGHAGGADRATTPQRSDTEYAGCGQHGAVTAEVAVVLPALVVLLAVLLGTAHIGTVQLRLEEAARAGAREVMRGESTTSVEQTVRRLAGSSATTHVEAGSGWTTVEVRARVEGPVVGLIGINLAATASGKEEHDG